MTSSSRLGLLLFGVYTVIYAAFVLLNAFAPTIMESTPVGGMNLAVLFGFALIIIAFVLSLVYGYLAVDAEEPAKQEGGDA
ncbi:MAG: DUF485 domain-containing protein [Planctomycetaceae bacterium]|nr:DUF485 domain-containing protein [Planctomycetaceae bacterium]MCA9030349.1 DUF485 domain-containing protein [Planctomycetaceae bacterium]MCA9044099.1 DUF485 domain-containing protein [Planctomycetaceae bacterium]MCB9953368.1 DUF485 domain-containing protein [Planctomycetaceae bacterium]